ncbi:Copper-transporting atpase, partial [Globisporangium splendens]
MTASTTENGVQTGSMQQDATTTYELAIEGMMCMKNCGTTVQNTLRSVQGVQSAVVSFETHSARVVVAPGAHVTADDLIDAVECVGFGAASKSGNGGKKKDPLVVELLVEGMMCQKNCGTTVENALRNADGVLSAVVSFEKRMATVMLTHEGSTNEEALIDMVECVGFSASEYDPVKAMKLINQAKKEEQKDDVVVELADSPNPRVYFKVEGMSCAACVKAIEDLLRKKQGVLDCRVGLISQKAEIVFDRDLIRDEKVELAKCIEEAGYKATYSHTVESGEGDTIELKFTVMGMSCAACVGKIERAVGKLPGVAKVAVNLPLNKAHVHIQQMSATGPRNVMECITSLGYTADIDTGTSDQESMSKSEVKKWKKLLLTALLFSLPAMMIHMVLGYIPFVHHFLMTPIVNAINLKMLLMFLLATPVQFWIGKRYYVAAFKGLQHGMMGMDFLIICGTTASYIYSFVSFVGSGLSKDYHGHHFFESSTMLLTFVTLGKYMESMAKGKTADALSELAKLQPKTAILIVEGESDREIPIELVQRGDLLRVPPGDNVPTDGIVKNGTSACDESMLTGESMPVAKSVGDYVFGSTINQQGTLVIESSCFGGESSALSQICSLIEDAQLHKAPIQAYADRLASVFAPFVLGVSMLTFFSWYILLTTDSIPHQWKLDLGLNPEDGHTNDLFISILFAISVVVIACPCALGLATPTAVMVGCGVGAKQGVLIKGGRALEIAKYVDTIVFDKTGTLTVGHPSVTDVVISDRSFSPREVLYYGGSLECVSEHVLGKAIVITATEQEKLQLKEPAQVQVVPGRGIEGIVPRWKEKAVGPDVNVMVGNPEYCEEKRIEIGAKIREQMHELEMEGKTVVCVCIEDKLCGVIAMADTPRPESKAVVSYLKSMGLDVWLITGDNIRTASSIARKMGIDHVKAIALPGEKAAQIKALQSRVSPVTKKQRVVCMVGDGINDAPALAQADIGMAIGAGTQIAKAEADMILVKSKLTDVVVALDLARVVFFRIRLNFFFSVAYNFVGIPLAAGIFFPILHSTMPPACAGLAMAFSSVSVVISSLLLKRYRAPEVCEYKPSKYDEDTKVIELKKMVRTRLNTAKQPCHLHTTVFLLPIFKLARRDEVVPEADEEHLKDMIVPESDYESENVVPNSGFKRPPTSDNQQQSKRVRPDVDPM